MFQCRAGGGLPAVQLCLILLATLATDSSPARAAEFYRKRFYLPGKVFVVSSFFVAGWWIYGEVSLRQSVTRHSMTTADSVLRSRKSARFAESPRAPTDSTNPLRSPPCHALPAQHEFRHYINQQAEVDAAAMQSRRDAMGIRFIGQDAPKKVAAVKPVAVPTPEAEEVAADGEAAEDEESPEGAAERR